MKKILLTAVLLFTTSISITKAQCLAGAYTIGGTTPNYATITSAVAALASNGVCGPVVFNIRSGTYTEKITIPAIAGTSSVNTITFQSEALDSNSVTVQTSSTVANNYVFKLNGVDNLKIHKIKVKNISTAGLYTCVFYILNNSDNNEISNCILESPLSTTSNSTKSIILSGSSDNENYNIKNNVFTGGSFAINYSGSVSTPTFFSIKNNVFYSQYVNGIVLTNVNSPVIKGNLFNYLSTISSFAIQLSACNDSSLISNNEINVTSGGSGIAISNCTGNTTKNILISNNKINGGGNSNGISLNNTLRTKTYHNTVVCSGTITSGYCISAVNTGTTNLIRNNIFYQKGPGLVYTTSSNGFFVSDYNDIYTAGIKFAVYNGVNYITCAAWKSGLNMDLNSTNYIPQFISTSDFHISSDFSQNITFPYFTEVSADFEGVIREVNSPYFGAYEFFNNTNLLDASINKIFDPSIVNCVGSQQVKVLLKNHSATSLTSSKINWTINGALQLPFNWVGNLNYYDTTSVTIGNLNFLSFGNYILKAWTSDPNGVSDTFILNDSAPSITLNTSLNGIYTVGGATPDFINLATAVTNLNNRGVCGNVTLNIRAGTYIESALLLNINGLSGSNTLTIQSETGVASSVTVYSNTSQNTFKLAGADNVIIKHITIGNASVAAPLVLLNVGSDNIEISNCILFGGGQYAIHGYLVAGTVLPTDIRIINNTFNTGSYNIRFDGSSAYWKFRNVKINNNAFNAPASGLMLVSLVDTLEFLNNRGTNVTGPAPNFSTVAHAVIKNNTFSAIDAYEISESIFANNMITSTGRSAVSIVNGSALKFINNSINCFDANTGTPALSIGSMGSPLLGNKFWNNCIVNNGTGKLISSSDKLSFKKNVYYGGGSIFGTINGTDASDLNSWKSLTVSDTGSFTVNPLYVSASDLHLFEPSLKNAGVDVSSWITDDYDGQARDVSPDIGADEFIPIATDASLVSFENLLAACPGPAPVEVKFLNSGSSIITSASVFWQVNGVAQITNNWTGSLIAGSTTIVSLGNYNLLNGVNYTIKAWIKNPNGITDSLPSNDTIRKNNFWSALAGIYTIGGTSPHYTTFNAAVNDLILKGVCGPVNFNVRNGVYNEKISIPFVNGSSALNTIVFQSETGDSSAVIISYSPNGGGNTSTINFNASSFVSIKKITIKALTPTYGNASAPVISFTGNNKNITLSNNIIEGMPVLINSTINSIIHSNAVQNKFFTIENNLIKNGSYGVFLNGISSVQVDSGIVIRKNIFVDQYYNGICLKYQESPYVLSNSLRTNSTGAWTGLISDFCLNSQKISNNTISSLASSNSNGININNASASSLARGVISNNMISVASAGISIGSSNYQNVYFNSILVTSIAGKCLIINSNSNLNNENNIYCNSGGGYALSLNNLSNLSVSDHNSYSTTGTNLVLLSGNSLPTFSSWQLSSLKDANSYNYIPAYYSSADLHLFLDTAHSNKGIFISGIVTDIDGENRDLSSPDIGADEYEFSLVDAALISLPSPSNLCSGLQQISVKLKNEGSTPLSTATINWSIDGVIQPPVIWSGNLIITDTVTVLLGNRSFTSGTTYNVKSWVSNPNNNLIDLVHENDTIRYQLLVPLNGVYTIGGTSPDYSTITAAANALNTYGVCGPVIFKIRAGIYSEDVRLGNIFGSSAANRVSFESENMDSSSVEWRSATYTSLDPIVILDSSDYVTFRKVTFRNVNSSRVICIKLGNGANYNEIRNCQIISQRYASSAHGLSGSQSAQVSIINGSTYPTNTEGNNHNIFENNIFIDGDDGFYIASSSPSFDSGNSIKNNVFSRFSGLAITAIKQKGMKITGNTINPDAGFIVGFVGIRKSISLFQMGDSLTVSGNNVTTKLGNHSLFVEMNSFATARIVNNYFHFIDAYSSGATSVVELLINANSTVNLINNTIRVDNSNCTGVSVKNYGTLISYNNNIVLNNSQYAFACSPYAGSFYSGNNNNFYNVSGSLIAYNSIYSTLAAYQSGTGKDLLSFNKNPHFSNGFSYEINSADLNNAAAPFNWITNDINGAIRNTTNPDIGCYEFANINADAGITNMNSSSINCSGSKTVIINITNFGTSNLTSAIIGWTVNGISQPSYSFNGSLIQNDSATNIVIGSFASAGNDIIKVFPTTVNGIADVNSYNDTLVNDRLAGPLNGIYTVGFAGADFASFTEAKNKLVSNGICGPVVFKVIRGVYFGQVIFPNIQGASIVNTITFESIDGNLDFLTMAVASGGPYVFEFKLDSAKYFRFKKLNFKVLPDNNNSGSGPLIAGYYSKNIIIDSCIFTGTGPVNPGAGIGFLDCDSIQITNNFILDVYVGMEFSGSNSMFTGSDLLIENNNLSNVFKGVVIKQFDNALVKSNSFESVPYIHNTGSPSTTVELCKGIIFEKNKLLGFDQGLNFKKVRPKGSVKSKVINNFICGYSHINDCRDIEFLFNNMLLDSSVTNTNQVATLNFSTDTNIVLYNNNIVNSSPSVNSFGAIYGYVNISDLFANSLASNNNNFFCPNTPHVAKLSSYGNLTLLQWQNNFNLDSSSFSIDPHYVSMNDLHVSDSSLIGLGKAITGITTDIDNDIRSAVPSIGADEYNHLCIDTIVTQSLIVCSGQNIIVGLNSYSNGGIYNDTLLTYQGCDSIVITNLTVNSLPIVTITTNGSTNFCVGGNVVLDAGAGYVNYLWSNGNTSQTIQVTSSEHDSVTVTDGNGCSATSSATIVTVSALPVLTVTDPSDVCSTNTIDISSSTVTFGSSAGSLTYWEDIAGTVSLNSSYYTVIDTSGTYYIKLDSGGCFDIKPVIVTIYKDCVWPGDANHDSIVNNFDLLPIGLYYSQTGSPRTSISNAWQGFPSTDWGTLQTNGSDIKQVDCNGNGLIDNNDTLAVNLNFSLIHATVVNNYSDLRTGDPAIYFIIPFNSYNAGDWVNVEVWTGTSTIPVSNLYGIAFNINYDVSLVQPGTESLTYPNSTWLGTPGINTITIAKTDPLASTSYGGITRIDHINANGFGKVSDFKFQVKTNLQSPSTFHFSISNFKANDAAGLPIIFAPSADSIVVYPLTTAVAPGSSIKEFTISPNPFSTQTFIKFNEEQIHTIIKVTDVLGKEIKTINFSGKQLIIEKENMQKGIYFVQVKNDQGLVLKKMVIN